MKRSVALMLSLAPLAACSSSDTTFRVEDGICYRIREERTLVLFTHTSKTLALPQNCGL